MRFHVLAIPYSISSPAYSACAFTQKVIRFCKMMHQRGHTVFHYGHVDSVVQCTEHIPVTDDAVLKACYKDYDWKSKIFTHSITDSAHKTFNENAIREVRDRKQPFDFLLLFWSQGHMDVAKAHSDLIVVEPGIGSFNDTAAPFSVFESYSVMHYIYGKYNKVPRFYDAVIPSYFDPDEFVNPEVHVVHYLAKVKAQDANGQLSPMMKTVLQLPKKKYIVLLARLISQKGIDVAFDACRETGFLLVVAGQGDLSSVVAKSKLEKFASSIQHIGYVEPTERAVLLANSYCLMMPTLYAEPFGFVCIEAQMSGIPVITTDWGAFPETVVHGVTGYRCRTMDHFIWAIKNVKQLDTLQIRQLAIEKYGFNKIYSMFEEYFSMLLSMYQNKGFYAVNDSRTQLDWLCSPKIGCAQNNDTVAPAKFDIN